MHISFRRHIFPWSIATLFISCFMAMLCGITAHASTNFSYASSSILSTGKWVKVKVESDGVYRITRSDIQKWGFASSDWSNIRVYGYGGAPLPDYLTVSNYIDDVPPTPVIRTDDAIIFYGKGCESWNVSGGTHNYTMQQHPYATAGYYFITANSELSEKTPEESTLSTIPDDDIATTFNERIHYEDELTSPGETGRMLLGEDFKYTPSRTFRFTLSDIASPSVSISTQFAARIIGGTGRLSFSCNGSQLSNMPTVAAITDTSHDHCVVSTNNNTVSLDNEDLSWGISFSSTGATQLAALNYISINYTRSLRLSGESLFFRGNSAAYSLECTGDLSNIRVLDITAPSAQWSMATTANGTALQFPAIVTGTREYVAIDLSKASRFSAPTYVGTVANQNLHGEQVPDIIIVTPSEYSTQAARIATLHEKYDGFRTLIVTEEQAANEFSSGTPDLNAVRRLAKMYYDRGADDTHSMRYIILLGRGSYDNRGISTTLKKAKYPRIFTWQTPTAADEYSSYCTDDIYGMLSDGTGANIAGDKMDIAVGRFTVTSSTEAKETVDKLETYMANSVTGAWKNRFLVIADDDDYAKHMKQSDTFITNARIADTSAANGFFFKRLYTDSYESSSSGSGRSYPGARKALFEQLNDGALWVNYVGHANPNEWTHEGLLTTTDIDNKFYYRHLPMFYTATCEFTRWDADDVSGGERLFVNPSGGAIALISTQRVALIESNGELTAKIGSQVLKYDSDGKYQRIGDILRNAKNAFISSNDNKLRYSVIGDPALRLGYPTHTLKLESVNGNTISADSQLPVIEAGSNVTFSGSVYTPDGTVDTEYCGIISPTLYDAEESVVTFGNGENGEEYLYQEHSNMLYAGQDSILNGRFNIQFRMPNDIANNYSPAMLNLYAISNTGVEANGSSEQLYVFGYSDDADADNQPPVIESMALNNVTNFSKSVTVNDSPLLIAKVTDDSGINLSTASIGHQMTLTLDDKTRYDDIATYYTPAIASTGGTISYPLSDLSTGSHTLTLKVWDVANNSSESTISFNVAAGLSPELFDVYTTSNPAHTEAVFYLSHNRPESQITVTIEVFDLMGRPVWSTTASGRSEMFTSMPITWNLCNNSGSRVARGIYIYRASLSTDGVTYSNSKSKKLGVAAQ